MVACNQNGTATLFGPRMYPGRVSCSRLAAFFRIASDHFMVAWGRVERCHLRCCSLTPGSPGGSQAGGVGDKQAGIKLEQDKASAGAGAGGNLNDRALRRAPPVVWASAGRERAGALRWAVSLGEPVRLSPCGMVGHDFFRLT